MKRLQERPHFLAGELVLAPTDLEASDYVVSFGKITGLEFAIIYDAETRKEIERITMGRADRVNLGQKSFDAMKAGRVVTTTTQAARRCLQWMFSAWA